MDNSSATLADALLENAPACPHSTAGIREAIQKSVAQPGQLIRAKLVHQAVLTHTSDPHLATLTACAIEYYHIASLLLDDLPCMDDATHRRGALCLHRTHGEANTILTALALINRAYSLLGFALATQPADLRLRAQATLDTCLGPSGIIGGQADDLAFASTDRSARTIGRIALRKTGSLFWLSIYLPALLARPTDDEQRHLRALCTYWGLAYQIRDDLADAQASLASTGKTPNRDRTLNRPNLAHALGLPATRRRLARLLHLSDRALALLTALHPRWHYLRETQKNFTHRPAARASADTFAA